mmetsp:Transcript_1397/g.2547  ORF Transcript_1397/g.2547 Transcript_1397/m.2547 type:complete len:860 (+) Transcript_1397:221-2800(+)
MRMGSAFSHPLTITLLLSLVPLSTSWGLFKKPPPPGSTSDPQTLANIAIDSFQNGSSQNAASSASSSLGSLPAYQQLPDLLPIWELFSLPKVITDTIPAYLKAILLFKPPVGITAVYVFFNLILSRNKKLVQSLLLDEGDQQAQISRRNRRKTKIGRSLDLDEADGKLRMGLGGVEAVRAELCLAVLDDDLTTTTAQAADTATVKRQDPFQGDPKVDLSNPETRYEFSKAAKDALRINTSPRSAKEDYIESTLGPLSRLEGLFALYKSFDAQFYQKLGKQRAAGDRSDADVLWMSAKVAEVRTLDALLRVLRERLLTSAVRLSKKEKYRAWRLQWYENGFARLGKRWVRKILKGRTLEDDRVNLQLTSAALKREMERLGQVQMLLLNRPTELSETLLLMAASATQQADEKWANRSGKIDAAGARVALQAAYKCKSDVSSAYGYDSIQMYTVDAHEWTVSARALIYELLTETLTVAYKLDEKVEHDRNTTVEYDLQTLAKWATYEKCDLEGWDTALTLTENLSKARLMREQKYLPTAIDLKQLWKRIDVLGIPSSLAVVAGALVVHNVVYIPYWDDIVESGKFLIQAVWGVIEFRFWTPLKDIVLDLLNRRPRLLDPYALANEETSLDNMLKDLGIGDGTKEGRPEALAEASRMYEKELAQGAIKNLFRGAMVRLLLIQVQQLKTGSLQAMGSIDDLMDSNRLNVQLLATIPAILLVTFGTRIFFRALYSLRSRDLIGLPNAKAEMGDLLRKMERCLLLASHAEDNFESSGALKEKAKGDILEAMQKPVVLQPKELGEFLLHMHSYLVILDFCSPPFPTKGCDSIHSALQDLLMQGQLSTKRQIALLQLINTKHNELMKV